MQRIRARASKGRNGCGVSGVTIASEETGTDGRATPITSCRRRGRNGGKAVHASAHRRFASCSSFLKLVLPASLVPRLSASALVPPCPARFPSAVNPLFLTVASLSPLFQRRSLAVTELRQRRFLSATSPPACVGLGRQEPRRSLCRSGPVFSDRCLFFPASLSSTAARRLRGGC